MPYIPRARDITITSKYNVMYVSYEDGDTQKMLESEFNNIHQSTGRERERERERAVYTLCKALPNSSP